MTDRVVYLGRPNIGRRERRIAGVTEVVDTP